MKGYFSCAISKKDVCIKFEGNFKLLSSKAPHEHRAICFRSRSGQHGLATLPSKYCGITLKIRLLKY